jgi:hypothetical protein
MPTINWLAVIAATVASFAVGAVWYSPLLFVKAWLRETGVTPEKARSSNMALTMGGAFFLTFLMTLVFALFLGQDPGVKFGAAAGFAAGLFWVAASVGVNHLFEGRSLKLFLINGGYNVAMFTVMGAVLGALQ